MSNALFHAGLLSRYQLVTKPGTYQVSAAFTITDTNLYMGDDWPRYLIPLRAMTGDGLNLIIKALSESPTGSVPFKQIRDAFLTAALFWGEDATYEEKDLPITGEKILATFEHVEKEDGRLLCTHVVLIPREELDYIDPDNFDQFRLVLQNLITKSIT
jgi:hypothetical protein